LLSTWYSNAWYLLQRLVHVPAPGLRELCNTTQQHHPCHFQLCPQPWCIYATRRCVLSASAYSDLGLSAQLLAPTLKRKEQSEQHAFGELHASHSMDCFAFSWPIHSLHCALCVILCLSRGCGIARICFRLNSNNSNKPVRITWSDASARLDMRRTSWHRGQWGYRLSQRGQVYPRLRLRLSHEWGSCNPPLRRPARFFWSQRPTTRTPIVGLFVAGEIPGATNCDSDL
jgi:hypothetical protein